MAKSNRMKKSDYQDQLLSIIQAKVDLLTIQQLKTLINKNK